MFDISFTELGLCFLVALIVLGPEKLPKIARTFGNWAGRAKSYMRNLSAELERETQVMEVRRQLQETQQALREAETSARSTVSDLSKDFNKDLPKQP